MMTKLDALENDLRKLRWAVEKATGQPEQDDLVALVATIRDLVAALEHIANARGNAASTAHAALDRYRKEWG